MSRPRLVALVLALVTLLLYLPVRHAGFSVFDDNEYVTENPVVQQGLTATGLRWAFGFHASNWHPVTWLSHMFDCQLFGLNPAPQHLINVLLHVVNVVLLFALLLQLTKRLWPSALIAALFAWHPLHVESVAWVAERKDVLSMFFGLLTLLCYSRYAQKSQTCNLQPATCNSPPETCNPRRWYGAALLCFALGLMSKSMLVTLPFVMLLLDYWPLGRVAGSKLQVSSWRALVVEKIPFFLLTAVSCVLTYLAQRGTAVVSFDAVPFGERVANAFVVYVGYLVKTIWPASLAVIYPLRTHTPATEVLIALALLAGISILVWCQRRSRPYLLVGWLWYLGTLVPVIGLVQVGGQSMADRYTYLPLVGIFVMMVFGLADLAARLAIKPRVLALLTALVFGGCLMVTARQLAYWQNDEMLFQHALTAGGDSSIARINLGVALERAGQRDDALEQYRRALKLSPSRPQIHNNIAGLLDEMGQNDEALKEYQEAIRLKPDAPHPHENLGVLLLKLGHIDDALKEYAEADRYAPFDPRPQYLMGKAELKRGDERAAVAHFQEALRRDHNDFQSLTFLARTLASSTDDRLRDGKQALALATRASELSGNDQPAVLDALSMAQAETGDFSAAQASVQRALDACAAAGETNSVPELRQHLESYQSGKPWRTTSSGSTP